MRLRVLGCVGVFALAGCGSSDDGSGGGDDAMGGDGGTDPTHGTVAASFSVRPGVEIATVLDAEPNVPLTLYDSNGSAMLTLVTDEFGQAHFAYIPTDHLTIETGMGTEIPGVDGTTLKKGDGYVIRRDDLEPPEATEPFSVMGVHDVPETSLYEGQVLDAVAWGLLGPLDNVDPNDGFNYIEVRDGVKLSAMVRLPDPGLYPEGPYPTVIEYSGYSPSRPTDPEPGSFIAQIMGYATVGVNMRGSGCSGGVFDVFNPAQHADGYDIVEVVARQDWVKGDQVGMVGLSYAGIAQLYVARTRPPSLAAITPLSVIGDAWAQLWPGGIYNEGFTREWLAQRDQQASPGGQSWTQARIDGGDTDCEEHQQLRSQNIQFESFFSQLEFFPEPANDRSVPRLVSEIDVPVYLTGAWQDEQTGPQFANMLDKFDNAPVAKFNLFNGRHPDGYTPLVLTRWFEFLEFYVHKRVPDMDPLIRQFAPAEFDNQFGVTGLAFEDDRFPTFVASGDYAGALAQYEAETPIRVLFESGGDPALEPGAPVARYEAAFDSWPPPNAVARSFYFASDGSLSDSAGSAGVNMYRHDPEAGTEDFLGPGGYQLRAPMWDLDWTQFAEGDVLSYLTDPFTEDSVIVGPGYAELYFASEVDDVNVQVTLTEVRSDDVEVLVTSGWLRVGHRKVDEAASDELRIERTFKVEDFEPLVPGEFVQVKIPFPSTAHAFRAGSRLRVLVSTPGRNHARWNFTNPDYGGTRPTHSVAFGGDQASRLYLPFVEGIPVASGHPTCPGLRGQPCRDYLARVNSVP